jgi:hypothetical protein
MAHPEVDGAARGQILPDAVEFTVHGQIPNRRPLEKRLPAAGESSRVVPETFVFAPTGRLSIQIALIFSETALFGDTTCVACGILSGSTRSRTVVSANFRMPNHPETIGQF